jgi:hypothetical protein
MANRRYNGGMSDTAAMAIVTLALPAGILFAVLVMGRHDRFQFSLKTTLLWLIPFAAMLAWISCWEGPFYSGRRVVTHKTAMLSVLLDVGGVIATWHRGWFPTRAAIVAVIFFSLLFGWIAWKRHQELHPAPAIETHGVDPPRLVC